MFQREFLEDLRHWVATDRRTALRCLDLVEATLRDPFTGLGKPEGLIRRVNDRPGHDRRYSLDSSKLRALGWQPQVPFEQGLARTVDWYRTHEAWWRPIKEASPAFREHYQRHYRP